MIPVLNSGSPMTTILSTFAVDVKDDVLSQDSESFWQDDTVELIIDAGNLIPPDTVGFDEGLNGKSYDWGFHTWFTYNELLRDFDPNTGEKVVDTNFMGSGEWTFGPGGDLESKGTQSETGWMLEMKIAKWLLEGKDLSIPLV